MPTNPSILAAAPQQVGFAQQCCQYMGVGVPAPCRTVHMEQSGGAGAPSWDLNFEISL
jgi:hypothetical protein